VWKQEEKAGMLQLSEKHARSDEDEKLNLTARKGARRPQGQAQKAENTRKIPVLLSSLENVTSTQSIRTLLVLFSVCLLGFGYVAGNGAGCSSSSLATRRAAAVQLETVGTAGSDSRPW
jgi:hypothetical protein